MYFFRVIIDVLFSTVLFYSVKGEHYAINWTEASIVGLGVESHLQDPAVKPLAPCPCDLRSSQCDVQCCCDQDCNTDDKTLFSCLEGLAGGKQTPQDLYYNCDYLGPYSPEWHSTLCYIKNNNPYLGLFFKTEPVIQEYQRYIMRVLHPKYSYETQGIQEDLPYKPYYVDKSPVETLALVEEELVRGVLTFPQLLGDGMCVDSAPIHFLQDFSHQCSVILSPEACKNNLSLRSDAYLQESIVEDSDMYNIFPSVISDLSTLEILNTTVTYFCIKPTLKDIKVNGLSKQAEKYMSDAWNADEIYVEECSGMDLPVYNSVSQKCENVVLKVLYDFGWRGPTITSVKVDVLLGDVPVSVEGVCQEYFPKLETCMLKDNGVQMEKNLVQHRKHFVSLLQHFETQFHYDAYVAPGNETSINDTDSMVYNDTIDDPEVEEIIPYSIENYRERSGNPGYDIGRPLLAGFAVNNLTESENSTQSSFLFADLNNSTGLFIWKPDATSNCETASVQESEFGIDMFSACKFTPSKSLNCIGFREEVLNTMYQLIQADIVSKMGAPNVTDEDNFLPIILDSSDPGSSAVVGSCRVPVALEHSILYQNIADTESRSKHVFQIIGVATRFQFMDIEWNLGENKSSLILSASIVYSDIPKPSKLSRFWEEMEDRWCAGGTCWRELFYPWTHGTDTAFSLYDEYTFNLLRNSAVIVLLCVPVLILIFHQTFQLRM